MPRFEAPPELLHTLIIYGGVSKMKKGILVAITLVLLLSLLLFTGCKKEKKANAVVVGASPVPHTEILEFVKGKLSEEGYELEIKEFTDYVQPNMATESGELDANFFQHVPYMDDFNKKNGTHMVSVFPVHFEPLGLYKARVKTIDDLPFGALIAVPNDETNRARALSLLEAAGLITLKEDVGLSATVLDIVDNPKNLDIRELEAAQIPLVMLDVDMAVINGNYALQAKLSILTDTVAAEAKDSLSAMTYANPIVVKAGNENAPGILALIKVLNTDEVRNLINEKYEGFVVPVF
jgi:D-methionine transport system substrate-binding protein